MSSVFTDTNQVHDIFQRLLEEINAADPHNLDSLVRGGLVVQFHLTDPETRLWVDGRTSPVEAHFGEQQLKPTVTATLTGDTLHELLLGTLALGKAISGGQLRVRGSIFKALKLESLFQQCQSKYPALAKEMLG